MVIWFAGVVALADIAPSPDFVEECTLAKTSAAGKECRECSGFHGGREPCVALEAEGFTKVCQTRGASTWTEVMCRTATTADPTPAVEPVAPKPVEEPAPSRCDHAGGRAALWLLVPVAALVRRRRSLIRSVVPPLSLR